MKLVLALLLAQADAGEPVFDALSAEVKRAMTLSMPAQNDSKRSERPYFASAFLTEQEAFATQASFGGLVSRGGARVLMLNGRIRVGSMAFDNTNFRSFGFDGRRQGAPAEPDPDALRQALWLRFDGAYKAALEDIARKRAYLETNEVSERLDDFAKAKTTSLVLPRATLSVDQDGWAETARSVSAAFLAEPVLQDGSFTFRGSADTQSMVTSEGSRHRFGANTVTVTLNAVAVAQDGAEVRGWRRFTGAVESDLPSKDELIKEAKTLGARVAALAKTKSAHDDYSGPVLFTGQAAGLFFLQTLAEPLASPRDELGARSSGRLTDRLGKHIASKLLDVVDDPTVKRTMVGGKEMPLWGSYPIDDDSVLPQRLSLVEAGVLKTYFMSRVPTAKLKESNGHCRGEQGAASSLFVSGREKTSLAALKKRLVELAKEEDSEYGLLVEQVEEYVLRSWGNDGQRLSNPVFVTKVFADGREEPVRGLVFKPVSQRVLKDVVAVGDEPSVLNIDHRGQPTSVVAPAVLVRLMELMRVKEENEKPPALARP